MKAGPRRAHVLITLAAGAMIAAPGAARAQRADRQARPRAPAARAPAPTPASTASAAGSTRTAARGAGAPALAPAAVQAAGSPEATAEAHEEGWTPGKLWSLGGLAGLYTGVGIWAYFAWYNGKPRNDEWKWNGDGTFGVNTYAGGSDKLGHFYSTLVITRATSSLLEAGGWRPLPASLIAGSMSAAYFTLIEVKDAYYYEFSVGDLVADLAGAGLGVLMLNRPEIDRLIDFRVDYWPTEEYRDGFSGGDVNFVEDYSGQTYLLALHLSGVPRLTEPRWMRWGRYVDLVGGFQSRNYKPEPMDPEAMESQHLFFGVALNVQGVLEDLYGQPADSGRARTSHRVLHSIFEYVSVPYTTLRVAEAERSKEEM